MEKDLAGVLPALAITTLVMSGLAIADAQEDSRKNCVA